MSLSDSEFLTWLESPRADRCLLAEIQHSAGTLYASNRGYISAPTDTPANQPYPAWLTGAPVLVESLTGDERPGALDLINDGTLDAELTRVYAGWPLTLKLGDPTWPLSDFRTVLVATVQDVTAPDLNKLSFQIRDRREALNTAITTRLVGGVTTRNVTFTDSGDTVNLNSHGYGNDQRVAFATIVTTTGIETDTVYFIVNQTTNAFKVAAVTGGSALPLTGNGSGTLYLPVDRPAPICLGKCFNIEPILIDEATLKYQVHNGAVSAISAVRDNGVAVTYTASVSTGTFTLNANPAGKITADVTGAGTATTAGLIDWLAKAAGLTAGDLDLSGFANTAEVGWYGAGDTRCLDVMQMLAQAAGAALLFGADGKLRLYRLTTPGTSALTLGEDLIEARGVKVARLESPYEKITVRYGRNFCVQDAASLAGAVTPANRDRYAREYRTVDTANSGVKTTWPLAEAPDVDTCFTTQAAAQAEADRRATLRAAARRVYTVNALAPAWNVRPGDTVTIQYPRYGLDAGVNAVVVRKQLSLSALRVILDLWV